MENTSLREIYARSIKLAVPVAAAYVVIFLGLVAEFLIVGQELGAEGLAAIGLAGTFSLVLVLSFHALEIAAQSIAARRYGQGDFRAVGVVLDNALVLAFVLGVPLAAGLAFAGPWLFSSAESERVTRLATAYFHYRLPGIPFLIAILTMIGFFNAIGRPHLPAYVYGGVLVVNAVLCWVLVGGRLGMPAMGIAGAGLAQTLAVILGFLGFLAVLFRRTYRRRYGVFAFAGSLSMETQRRLGALAWPVFVQQFFTSIGMFLFMVIVARVPDDGVSLGATTIARQVGYLTYLPSLGFGIAAATLVSQFLGAEHPRDARRSALACWSVGGGLMVLVGIAMILLRGPLVGLFLDEGNGAEELNAAVAEMAALLVLIVGGYQLLESVNTIMGKALQGAGATRTVMVTTVVAQWGVFLPLAYGLAVGAGMGAPGAMIAMAAQLMVAAGVLAVVFFRGRWTQIAV